MKTIFGLAIGMLGFVSPLEATVTVVDYWHLGENDPGSAAGAAMTNSADIVGGHTLTNSGALTYSTNVSTSASVATGSYLDLQFTSNAYATSAGIPNLTTNFGVELWVNPATASGSQSIFCNGNSGGSGWGLYVTDNTFSGLFGGVFLFSGSVTFTPGTWNHVALVESVSVATLYVNGVVSATVAHVPNNATGLLTVGANLGGTENFSGLIDEIRVFTFNPGQFSTNDLLLEQKPSYQLGVTNIQLLASAGSSNVALTVSPSNALWTASTTATWLHLPITAGMGSANVPFSFEENDSPASRSGTLTIAGITVTVTQAPPAFAVAVTNYTESGNAGSDAISLTCNASNATWTATANASWLQVTNGGAGGGLVGFSFDANPDITNRTGTLTIAGQTVNVVQLADNLSVVAYWRLGEHDLGATNGKSASTTRDETGNHDLVVHGSTFYSTNVAQTANSEVGSSICLDFSGTNGYANCNNFSTVVDNCGVELWVYPTSGGGVLCYNGNTGNNGWGLYKDGTNFTVLYGLVAFFGSAPAPTNTWSHLALVRNNGTNLIYLNGALRYMDTAHSPLPPSGNFQVGANNNGGENFAGLMDEVRVFTFLPGEFHTNDLLIANSQGVSAIQKLRSEPAVGGMDQISLNASNSESWTVSTIFPWLHPTVTNGTGSATVPFSFDENIGPLSRTGVLVVAGQRIVIEQAAPSYSLTTNFFTEPAVSTNDNLNLSVIPTDAIWTATANAPWLHLAATNGVGNATVNFTVDANAATNAGPRTGSMTIAGQTVTVNQAGPFSFVANLFVEPLTAGTDTVNLIVSPGASNWTAMVNVPWLHLSVTNGTGSSLIPFTFDTDVGFPPRAGTITVAGQPVTVLQGPQVVVTNLLEASGAGIETVPVFFLNYLPGALSATANSDWLHISPNGAHASPGNANVAFTLDANTNAAPRTGTLTIQGTTVTVTQAGTNYQAAGQMLFLDLSAYLSTNDSAPYGPVPQGLAVDPDGNLYITMNSRTIEIRELGFFKEMPSLGIDGYDDNTGFILKWSTNNSLSVLVPNPGEQFLFPLQVALDAQTNVYFNDAFNYDAVFELSAATGNVTQKIKVAPIFYLDSGCFVVDSAGNITVAADFEPTPPFICYLYELSALDHGLTNLGIAAVGTTPPAPLIDSLAMDPFGYHYFASSGLTTGTDMDYGSGGTTPRTPSAMAFDDSGNLYLSSTDGIFKLSQVDFGSDFTGVPISSLHSLGLAVDKARNIFGSDYYGTSVWVIPHAFVNAVPKWENGNAGDDSLPAVLPASANLNAQFAPTSDQPWLTITGVANGVVSYSFTANTGTTNRIAHINVLGVPVTVTQSVVAYPTLLTGVELLGSGSLQFSFTNNPNASAAAFTVLTTTNLTLPLAQWTVLGSPTNIVPGLFQFTDTQNTNGGARFYSVRLP